MPRLLELFCGTKSIGRAFEAAGWEVVSLDIVSKFEPTILCDIRSWDYTLFPPGHFDMVWVSPVCTYYSRALTMRRLGARNLRDGSYCLQPGERLSWEQEIPKTDLPASSPVSLSLKDFISQVRAYCLQPGERLSCKQESKTSPRRIFPPRERLSCKTDLPASSPVSASPGNPSVARIHSSIGRGAAALKLGGHGFDSTQDGSSLTLQPGERLS